MGKNSVILILCLFICSCTRTSKQQDDSLTYYMIRNEGLTQQILNYVDSVTIPCGEKMPCIYLHNLGYDDDMNKITQYDLHYETCAFHLLFTNSVYVKIDTLVISVISDDARDKIFLSDDIGWKYLKTTFKKDYQYYLDSIKTTTPSVYPITFDDINKYGIPTWTLIFENDELIEKIVW